MSAGVVEGRARTVSDLAALVDPARIPTEEQARVIGWGANPALVVAGAGSGKTETLSMRMVYLLDHAREIWGEDISPDEILCLTFTRKAAAEIADRAGRRIDSAFGADAARPVPTVATYNAYSAGLVGEHGLRVGVDPDSVVLTDASLWQMSSAIVEGWAEDLDAESAVSSIIGAVPRLAAQLSDHGASPHDLARICEAIAQAVGTMPSGALRGTGAPTKAQRAEAAKFRARAAMAPLLEEFARRKRDGSFLDFADQVALAGRLARIPAVRAVERSRYRAVLLDEFQDTSHGQMDLFALMFGQSHPVMAVGDPHQAIYGFRGASADSLAAFVDRFGGEGEVGVLSLSVSWRNARGVLEAANSATEPLRARSKVPVPVLRAREGAASGIAAGPQVPAVSARMYGDTAAEARGVVDALVERRSAVEEWRIAAAAAEGRRSEDLRTEEQRPEDRLADGGRPGDRRPATAAILCRARRQFPAIVAALRAAGVQYQVVGLGGLLDTPEVVELVALLECAHDPSRGDSLMRLLASERFALGAADLAALGEWSRELAGPRDAREGEPSILDAVESLPKDGWRSREGRPLTASARERLREVRALIAVVRAHTYLPLGELVAFAWRADALDIECAASRPQASATVALDAFADVARSFASGAERATLGAFLAWLDAARDEESGLDSPVAPPDPAAVQVQTIHSAKGLEWDVVAVPGLMDGRFPKVDRPTPGRPGYRDGGWTSGLATLPWPLRRDAAGLPDWRWQGSTDAKDWGARKEDFRLAAGAYRVEEERRLFYVAVTRAFFSVILTGAWWDSGVTPFEPSLYMSELADRGIVSREGWEPRPEANPSAEAPPLGAPWPPDATRAQRGILVLAAEVGEVVSRGASGDVEALPHGREIAAMLAEQAARSGRASTVAMPAHLSATELVSLARDAGAFARDLRRPIPAEPTEAAARGSAFHGWVEAHYGAVSLWDGDDAEEEPGGDIGTLQEAFLASPWAARMPLATEARVEVPLGSLTLRSQIDAVFPAGGGLDRITVVDWKTGAPPKDPGERAAREVQLATYRLAWSRWKGIPIEEVDAVFFYASTGQTVAPERMLGEEEIVALMLAAVR
jgi:DNA helicase-2/ATP-dependent DNA helicase PcrA